MDSHALQTLLEELDRIDRRAHRMALELLDAPLPRPDLAAEAAGLSDRLAEVADALEAGAPDARRQRSSQISEATVDLDHVSGKTRFTSRRIGRRLREPRERE
jgi:hypothetical protein